MLARTVAKINAIEKAIRTGEALRPILVMGQQGNAVDAIVATLKEAAADPIEARIYDHCAAITRLYALYEAFIEDALETWLEYLEQNGKYTDLPETMQNHYRSGMARVFQHFDKARYAGLKLADVARSYAVTVGGQEPFTLLPQALIYHEVNLRMDILNGLFGNCDVTNIADWLEGHTELGREFDADGRWSGPKRVAAAIGDFVDYRNEASHKAVDVDDLLSSDELIRLCRLISALCTAVSERVVSRIADQMIISGKAIMIGKVTERFKNGAVIAVVKNAFVGIGDELYAVNQKRCRALVIKSIQVESRPCDSLTVEGDEREIGLVFDEQPNKGTQLIQIHN